MRRVVLGSGALALVLGVAGCGEDDAQPLTVAWDDADGSPACRYDPDRGDVAVRLRMRGDAGGRSGLRPQFSTAIPVFSAVAKRIQPR